MRAISGFFVRVFEYAIPDPYVFAVLLTLLTGLLARIFAPHHTQIEVLSAWYKGIFDIFEFALQMILIFVTGYALASSAPISCATIYGMTSRTGKCRSTANVNVTAGLKCAPETCPNP